MTVQINVYNAEYNKYQKNEFPLKIILHFFFPSYFHPSFATFLLPFLLSSFPSLLVYFPPSFLLSFFFLTFLLPFLLSSSFLTFLLPFLFSSFFYFPPSFLTFLLIFLFSSFLPYFHPYFFTPLLPFFLSFFFLTFLLLSYFPSSFISFLPSILLLKIYHLQFSFLPSYLISFFSTTVQYFTL